MHAQVIKISNGFPHEGQQIEFLLEGRNVAMEGSYTLEVRRSHLAEYAVDRVCSERNLRDVGDLATPVRKPALRVLSRAPRLDPVHVPLHPMKLAHAT